MADEVVRLVNDATALWSMRESDFNASSAWGEVIDNSIQANARRILIAVQTRSSGKKGAYEYIQSVAFGDDGCGMDPDVLRRCMQLGYSSRYNDRTGIGRFGVGMTLGAINQCKRVEIFSKTKSGAWMWTYVDLDDITASPTKMDSIPEPSEKGVPSEYNHLVGDETGTLVIWTKYDRQPESAPRLLKRMRTWIGRTYRYFIWEGVEIKLDGESVPAIDPLYVSTDMVRFPDDPPAEEFPPIEFSWPVPEEDQEQAGTDKSTIKIRMSLLPEELRPHRGIGGASSITDRGIDTNEGVSIVRNGREVFYGRVPYWPKASGYFKEIDRWWGCEIIFDATLDRAFTVKNIKRGALPNPELKGVIADMIHPSIESCRETVRAVWREFDKRKAQEERDKEGVATGHEDAEGVAKKTPTDKGELDKHKNIDEEAAKLIEQLEQGRTEEEKAAWIAKFKSQPFTLLDDSWSGPEFFEAIHLGGSDVIKYNLDHLFFQTTNDLTETLENGEADIVDARKLKNLIDLLLISYAKGQTKFDAQQTLTAEDFVEFMRLNWGQYLVTYMRTWLRESADEH